MYVLISCLLLIQARLFDEPQLASLCLENIDKNTGDALAAEGFTDIDLGNATRILMSGPHVGFKTTGSAHPLLSMSLNPKTRWWQCWRETLWACERCDCSVLQYAGQRPRLTGSSCSPRQRTSAKYLAKRLHSSVFPS